MRIGLIVEGHGDVASLPILLRNICFSKEIYNCSFPHPMRFGEFNAMLNREKFPNFVQYLNNNEEIDAIIIACDADDICPVKARKLLLKRISDTVHDIRKPIALLLFNREYEALFLSQIDILTGKLGSAGLDDRQLKDTIAKADQIRGAKEFLRGLIPDLNYKEARDQEKLTAILDIEVLGERHRAGLRAVRIMERLAAGEGDEIPPRG